MPNKPMKPCNHVGCCHLTSSAYCTEHQQQANERRAAHMRNKDRKRGSASKRGYTKAWSRYRRRYLAKNPWCAECKRNGILHPATEVDHIKPHKGNRALFWDTTNHQGLCKSCHSRKTASEDGGFGNKIKTKK